MKVDLKSAIKLKIKCPKCGEKIVAGLGSGIDTVAGTCSECGHTFTTKVPHLTKLIERKMAEATREALEGSGGAAEASSRAEVAATGAGTRDPGTARQVALALNLAGVLIGSWAIIHPHPYRATILLCVLVQAASLVAVARSRGAIRLLDTRRTRSANVFVAFLLPALAIAVRAAFDVQIEDYSQFWLPFAAAALVLVLLTFRIGVDPKRGQVIAVLLVPLLLVEAYGLTTMADVLFDTSARHTYEVSVLGKIANGHGYVRSHRYFLKVSPWAKKPAGNEVDVSHRVYRRTRVTDHVVIAERAGSLRVPWYVVLLEHGSR